MPHIQSCPVALWDNLSGCSRLSVFTYHFIWCTDFCTLHTWEVHICLQVRWICYKFLFRDIIVYIKRYVRTWLKISQSLNDILSLSRGTPNLIMWACRNGLKLSMDSFGPTFMLVSAAEKSLSSTLHRSLSFPLNALSVSCCLSLSSQGVCGPAVIGVVSGHLIPFYTPFNSVFELRRDQL